MWSELQLSFSHHRPTVANKKTGWLLDLYKASLRLTVITLRDEFADEDLEQILAVLLQGMLR